jgi:taurine transport system substrate-binding protein
MKPKFRNILLATLLILAFALQLTGCGKGGDTTENKPKVITIGYQAIPNDEILAKAKGWYESELGVKVNFKQFDSGRDINSAFASNSIDFGYEGSAPTAVGISQGIPYEVFWIHEVIGTAESLVVKKNANINSVKDLKGKRIATPFASTSHYSLLNALKLEGVNASDVKILDMPTDQIFAAWQRGDIDGAYIWDPTLSKLLADGKIITDSSKLAEKGIVTADMGVVSKAFAQKYPDLVTKYIKLQKKAYDLYNSNPDEAAAAIGKELNIDKAEALRQSKGLIWLSPEEELSEKYFGSSSKKGDLAKILKSTADFLVDQKSIPSAPELDVFEKAINSKYIEDALK